MKLLSTMMRQYRLIQRIVKVSIRLSITLFGEIRLSS